MSVRVCLCTAPDADVAAMLAKGLVEQRLAACVNILPQIRSVYRLEGAVHDDAEVLLIIKTSVSRFAEMRAWLEEAHPYDVPEVLALPVDDGASAYVKWVLASVEPSVE